METLLYIVAIYAFVTLLYLQGMYFDIHDMRRKYMRVEDFRRKYRRLLETREYEGKANDRRKLVLKYEAMYGEEFEKYAIEEYFKHEYRELIKSDPDNDNKRRQLIREYKLMYSAEFEFEAYAQQVENE